jgi:hypothetical protein
LRCRQAGRRFFEQTRASVKYFGRPFVRVVASADQGKTAARQCEKPHFCRPSPRNGRANLGYNLVWRRSTHQLRALAAPLVRFRRAFVGANFPHASTANIHAATRLGITVLRTAINL